MPLHTESAFDSADPDAMARYIKEVLDVTPYPWMFDVGHEVSFEAKSETAVVDVSLIPFDSLIDVAGYRFLKSRMTAKPFGFKGTELNRIYQSAVEQSILATLSRTLCTSIPSERFRRSRDAVER